MDTVGKVFAKLDEVKASLLEYEAVTQELLTCDADSVENYITARGEIANKIDAKIEEIRGFCAAEPNGELIYKAAMAQVNYNELSPDLVPLFELGQSNMSAVGRVKRTEEQAMERLVAFKKEAQDKMKQSQHVPKIKKYLTDLSDKSHLESMTNGKA